jgi:hypothetical protein
MEKTRPMDGVQYDMFCAQVMIEEAQLHRDEKSRGQTLHSSLHRDAVSEIYLFRV